MATVLRIIMIGATGAVGGHAARVLAAHSEVEQLTLLGRRPVDCDFGTNVVQHVVDLMDSRSYAKLLAGHTKAVCTVGVGESSTVSKETFVRVDKTLVLAFAKSCKEAGIEHFELLGSVATNPKSASFYFRTKGELVEGLKALGFKRLSVFQPSMILTPQNRYGLSQAVILKTWPWLHPLLFGSLRKYRGIPVARLGRAIANNLFAPGSGFEVLHWDEFQTLTSE
ncbi:MAG: NAD(P)H-binding protein [Luteolibacter sp.]